MTVRYTNLWKTWLHSSLHDLTYHINRCHCVEVYSYCDCTCSYRTCNLLQIVLHVMLCTACSSWATTLTWWQVQGSEALNHWNQACKTMQMPKDWHTVDNFAADYGMILHNNSSKHFGPCLECHCHWIKVVCMQKSKSKWFHDLSSCQTWSTVKIVVNDRQLDNEPIFWHQDLRTNRFASWHPGRWCVLTCKSLA